ncbi:CHAD domain-containing protein [Deinococcus wulumuqiensis]
MSKSSKTGKIAAQPPSLTGRLDALWPDLVQGDPKAVHEARKLTRKVAAELAVSGAPKKVRRAWRDLRRAVAPLRDHDVAGEHLAAALSEEGRPQREITAFRRDWQRRRAALLAGVLWPEPPPAFERPDKFKRRTRRALAHEAQTLLEDTPDVLSAEDPETWHEWRKALKHYRYTLELLGDPPEELLGTLDALGRMQDAEVVRGLLEEHSLLPDQREALLARELEARQTAQEQVRALWPELKAHLKEQVE